MYFTHVVIDVTKWYFFCYWVENHFVVFLLHKCLGTKLKRGVFFRVVFLCHYILHWNVLYWAVEGIIKMILNLFLLCFPVTVINITVCATLTLLSQHTTSSALNKILHFSQVEYILVFLWGNEWGCTCALSFKAMFSFLF